MTREETMMVTDDKQKEKIKTPFAKVIVEGRSANSYFSILYFHPADKDFHIGYSSYYLDYVFNWLNEKFEIVEDGNFTFAALRPVSREQVEKVWRGEWKPIERLWKYSHQWQCSRCGQPTLTDQKQFCDFCGAPMTDEAVDILLKRLEELHDG